MQMLTAHSVVKQ